MKARTMNEKEVERLSKTLKQRKSVREWIENTHKVGYSEYFAVYETKGDWQVIRMFMYRSWSKKWEAVHEPLRYWIKANGEHVIECKNRNCLGNYYIDPWIWDSELCIRANKGSRDVRNLFCSYVRVISLIPELKRTGFRANGAMEKNLKPFWLSYALLTNNRVETFFKLLQTWLTWKFYWYDTWKLDEYWQSIRIALRHGYHWDSQDDINDWCDYVHDLQSSGLDTHNPHYICPANLKEAHSRLMVTIERKEDLERKERALKKALDYEPFFKATREQFFDMVLKDGHIRVKAIQTAVGIKEEGDAMHHCVGGYYNKPESLILSATINGKRLETVEVNLDSYELIQSRGLQNNYTEYHDRIVKLVTDNLDLIRVLNVNHKESEKKQLKKLRMAI